MNITAPPESEQDTSRPVFWAVLYADDTTTSSLDGTWNEQAAPRKEQGVTLFWSDTPVASLSLYSGSNHLCVTPPDPRPFFAFTRLASAATLSSPVWLYTAFGYALNDELVIVRVSPDTFFMCVEPRDRPFPF